MQDSRVTFDFYSTCLLADARYVIVENLRYFLSAFNTSQPLWFGHKFKAIVKSGYFSGGAGESFGNNKKKNKKK
jgi:hypothetical protein